MTSLNVPSAYWFRWKASCMKKATRWLGYTSPIVLPSSALECWPWICQNIQRLQAIPKSVTNKCYLWWRPSHKAFLRFMILFVWLEELYGTRVRGTSDFEWDTHGGGVWNGDPAHLAKATYAAHESCAHLERCWKIFQTHRVHALHMANWGSTWRSVCKRAAMSSNRGDRGPKPSAKHFLRSLRRSKSHHQSRCIYGSSCKAVKSELFKDTHLYMLCENMRMKTHIHACEEYSPFVEAKSKQLQNYQAQPSSILAQQLRNLLHAG